MTAKELQALKNGSRKYKLTLIALLLITGAWSASGLLPGLGHIFSELIAGIIGILMLYFTGNVSNKFVVGRHLVASTEAATEAAKLTSKTEGEPNGS